MKRNLVGMFILVAIYATVLFSATNNVRGPIEAQPCWHHNMLINDLQTQDLVPRGHRAMECDAEGNFVFEFSCESVNQSLVNIYAVMGLPFRELDCEEDAS